MKSLMILIFESVMNNNDDTEAGMDGKCDELYGVFEAFLKLG